ncbi:MAG: hypothetical protein HGN29_08835 [Asgard group archaeon]|nr:hypothetical protein [Asgard group archaeon]
MVLKTIERIKRALPEVEHIVMFYNDGIVYQTTFEQFEESVNIPKLGNDLSNILSNLRTLYEICNYNYKGYNQLLFDTDEIDVLILKLGENSNLALFFRKSLEDGEIRIKNIQKYITKIEKLIDIGQMDLFEKDIRSKERDLKSLYEEMEVKLEKQKSIQILLGASSDDMKDAEKIEKEIEDLNSEIQKQEIEKDQRTEEITRLNEKIMFEEERIDLLSKELKLKKDDVKDLKKIFKEKTERRNSLETIEIEERDEEKFQDILTEINGINEKLEIAQHKVKDTEVDLDLLKIKLEEDNLRIVDVEEDRGAKEKRILALNRELKKKMKDAQTLREVVELKDDIDKIDKIEIEITNLNEKIEQLKITSEEKKKEMQDLESGISDIEKEIEKHEKKENEMSDEINDLQIEINEKKARIEEINSLIKDEYDEKKIKKYEKEKEKLNEEVCDCHDNIAEDKGKLEESYEELKDLITKMKNERGRLERAKEELDLKDKQLNALYKELEAELDIQKTLLSSIDDKEDYSKAQKISKEIQELDDQIKRKKEEIENRKRDLELLTEKVDED